MKKRIQFILSAIFTIAVMSGMTARAQDRYSDYYDFQIDNLYFKITSTVGDSIAADVINIASEKNANLNIDRSYIYEGIPIKVSGVNVSTKYFGGEIGDTLSFDQGIIIKSLNAVTFKTIIIPEGANSFSFYAYSSGNPYVETVVLPNSMVTIAPGIFQKCDKLKRVYCGNNVKSIGDRAFRDCPSLTVITENKDSGNMLSKCETVGWQAFKNCSNLSEIHFSEQLKTIGEESFYECELTDISLGSVKVIPAQAITSGKLKNLDFLNNITTIRSRGLSIGTDVAIIPNSIKTIEREGFYYCSFKKVILGDSIKNLELNLFAMVK